METNWKDIRLTYDETEIDTNYGYLEQVGDLISAEQFLGCLFYTMHHEKEKIKYIVTDEHNLIHSLINDFSIRRELLGWLNFINDIEKGKRKIKSYGQYTYSQAFLLYHMYDIQDKEIKDKLEANYLMGIMISDKNLETFIELWKYYIKGLKK